MRSSKQNPWIQLIIITKEQPSYQLENFAINNFSLALLLREYFHSAISNSRKRLWHNKNSKTYILINTCKKKWKLSTTFCQPIVLYKKMKLGRLVQFINTNKCAKFQIIRFNYLIASSYDDLMFFWFSAFLNKWFHRWKT